MITNTQRFCIAIQMMLSCVVLNTGMGCSTHPHSSKNRPIQSVVAPETAAAPSEPLLQQAKQEWRRASGIEKSLIKGVFIAPMLSQLFMAITNTNADADMKNDFAGNIQFAAHLWPLLDSKAILAHERRASWVEALLGGVYLQQGIQHKNGMHTSLALSHLQNAVLDSEMVQSAMDQVGISKNFQRPVARVPVMALEFATWLGYVAANQKTPKGNGTRLEHLALSSGKKLVYQSTDLIKDTLTAAFPKFKESIYEPLMKIGLGFAYMTTGMLITSNDASSLAKATVEAGAAEVMDGLLGLSGHAGINPLLSGGIATALVGGIGYLAKPKAKQNAVWSGAFLTSLLHTMLHGSNQVSVALE